MVESSRSPERTTVSAVFAVVLAVAVLVIHARVVLGGTTWDDVRFHTEIAPPRLAASDAILAGEAPTWWDGSGLGVPLLGEPSHGAAYPLTWLAATPWLFDLLTVLHLFVLGLGVALWAKRLGATELASMIAGLLAAASGIAISAGLRGGLPALAFVPWVALFATSLRTRRDAGCLGLCIGAIGLTGSLALSFDAVVLALALGARGPTKWLATGVLGGLAITCAQWIPALAIAGDGAGATITALKLSRVLELVLPGSFGGGGDRAVEAIAGAGAAFPSLYVGASVFALAGLARPSRRVIGVAAILATLALVVGRGGGWPAWVGAPELHVAALAILAIAHAAVGIDAVFEGERRGLLALVGAAVATALAVAAISVLRSRTEIAALDRALLDGAIALACVVAAFVIAWRTDASWTPIALAALLVAPSVSSLRSTAPTIARSSIDTPMWAEAAKKAIDPTNPRAPLRIYRPISLYEEEVDSLPEAIATLRGASAARYGLAAARSEDPARPAIHDSFWLSASSVGGALLERFGISVAILPRAMVEGRSLGNLAQRGSWALAKFPATPPAAMVFEWIWLPDDASVIARLFPLGAGRGLHSNLLVLHGTGHEHQDEPREPEPCTVTRWARGAIDLTCASQDAESYAVVSSTSTRGWTVEVDGKDTPWNRADVMRRAVRLSPGAHVVSWRYEAPGLVAGVVIAAFGALALLVLVVLRAPREPGPDEN